MKFLTKILIFSFLLIFVSNGILSADEMLVRRFGNTGTKLGIIGINVGTYESNDKSAFKKALREGACFINTSPFVEGSEKFVAENLTPAYRERCLLTTHWKADVNSSENDYIRQFDSSLKNLSADFIDCIIIDEIREVKYLEKHDIFKAFYKLKKQKKVKYIGVHVKKNEKESLSKILKYVIKKADYDFIVFDYNTSNFNDIKKYIDYCGQLGKGVITLGTLEDSLKNEELARRITGRKKIALEPAVIRWAVNSTNWISSILIPINDSKLVESAIEGAVEEEDTNIFGM